jgi:DNA-binding SARP family transcriptional activator
MTSKGPHEVNCSKGAIRKGAATIALLSRADEEGRNLPADADLDLRLLGGFRLLCDGQEISLPLSGQRLVAYLGLHSGPILRVHVAGTLWPDTTERQALANLRTALWRLGAALPSMVQATQQHVALGSRVHVDFSDAVVRAHDLSVWKPSQGEDVGWAGAIDSHQAWSLLEADLLPDWCEDWVLAEQERFHQLRIHALETMSTGLATLGKFGEAIEAGLVAVAADPLREPAQRTLIRAYLAEGNLANASAQYESFRAMMQGELGCPPSVSFESLLRSNWSHERSA